MKEKFLLVALCCLFQVNGEPTSDAPECLTTDEFRISPGGYDPNTLTVEVCQERCREIDFKYAALSGGEQCLCSQSIEESVPSGEVCDEVCTGNADQKCGSNDLNTVTVYGVSPNGNVVGIILKITPNKIYTDDTADVKIEVEPAVDALVTVNFGDGTIASIITSSLSLSKHYRIPGSYNVVAAASTIPEGNTTFSEAVQVTVSEKLDTKLECPNTIKANEKIESTAIISAGSDVKFEVDVEGTELEQYEAFGPVILSVGLPVPEKDSLEVEAKVPNTQIRLQYASLPTGKIYGFEFYSVTTGDVDFLILRKDCSSQQSCLDKEQLCASQDSYTELYRYSTTANDAGYNFYEVTDEDKMDVLAGDVVGFESKGIAIGSREVTPEEKNLLEEDSDENCNLLEVRHYFRVLVRQPSRIYFDKTCDQPGRFYVNVTSKSETIAEEEDKDSCFIECLEPIEDLTLETDKSAVRVEDTYTLKACASQGTGVTLLWDIGTSEEMESEKTLVEDLKACSEKNVSCQDEGSHSVKMNASNAYSSYVQNLTVECLYPVTDNWVINTDSPKPYPPGRIEIILKYTSKKAMPTRPRAEISYNDGKTDKIELPESGMGPWQTTITHLYKTENNFTIGVHISNDVDENLLNSDVYIYPANQMFNVTVTHNAEGEKKEVDPPILHTYVDTDVEFEITFGDDGADCYQMKMEDGTILYNSSEPILNHKFSEPGDYKVTFIVCFYYLLPEYKLHVRAVNKLENLLLADDGSVPGYGVEKEFNITLDICDNYTCVVFDPDDIGCPFQAFGNEDICRSRYEENKIIYEGPFDISNCQISVNHSYERSRYATVRAFAFNTLSNLESEKTILIKPFEEGEPLVWVDNNRTLNNPDERKRSVQFRIETTTILTSNISYTARRDWLVYKVDQSGKELEQINITSLESKNFSALIVPPRFLKLGLYKFIYIVYILDEEDTNNILWKTDDYTYIRIIQTPLVAIITVGGVSKVRRGYGQFISLRPQQLSIDPDELENKTFTITWFCKRKGETLDKDPKGEIKATNPSSPIKDRSAIGPDNGGCFGKGPGVAEIGEDNIEFNTEWFYKSKAVYKMIVEVKKGDRRSKTTLTIEVVDGKPPSLVIECEKQKMCFPTVGKVVFNPNTWITLKATCISECASPLHYAWKIWAVKSNQTDDDNQIEITSEASKHIIDDKKRLGINQTLYIAFKEYRQFRYQIIAKRKGEIEGYAVIYLIKNDPPRDGICTINRTTGQALLDYFFVNCSGWIDPETRSDKLDDYSIIAIVDDDVVNTKLCYGTKTIFTLVLPVGDIRLNAILRDRIGAETTYSILNTTTELPSLEDYEAWNKTRAFDKALAEGNMCLGSQIAAAEASVMMKYMNSSAEQSDPNYIDQSAVDKEWDKFLNLSGKDSSYFTPQARKEIEELIQEKVDDEKSQMAKQNVQIISKMKTLPMNTVEDAEVIGSAVSSVAMNGLLSYDGKAMVVELMEQMSEVMSGVEVAHATEILTLLESICNIMDRMVTTYAAGFLGDCFYKDDRESAVEDLENDIDTENSFIIYASGGSKEENKEEMKKRAIEAASNVTKENAKTIITEIEELLSNITEGIERDLLTNESIKVQTKSGFKLFLKKLYKEDDYDSFEERRKREASEESSLLRKFPKTGVRSIQVIQWNRALNSYSNDAKEKLSKGTGTVQIKAFTEDDDYKRETRNTDLFSLSLFKRSTTPFEICVPRYGDLLSPPIPPMYFVHPVFSRASDIIVYHYFELEKTGVIIVVEFLPEDLDAPFILLHKCGSKPFLSDYDGLVRPVITGENETFTLQINTESYEGPNCTFYLGVGHLSNETDIDKYFNNMKAYNLTVANMTNEFSSNYSYRIFTTGCYTFQKYEEYWSTKDCKVTSCNASTTCCLCNRAVTVASGFFIAPNTIDFSYVFANADFTENITIYLTIIVTFCIYLCILIWARWKDRRDVQKLGATPLPDNDPNDKYLYEILVFTGHHRNAGTKSKVFFMVSGEDYETEVRTLSDGKRPILRAGSVDVFAMTAPKPMGDLFYLRIWHDSSGRGKWASWFLKYIVFRDVQTGKKFEFIANSWFAVEEGDGMIDRLLPVAGKAQKTEFSHLFSTTSRQNLSDGHLWFSIFLRPPRSRFTRCQRVSTCMAVLYLSMLVNAMWYERTNNQTGSGGLKLGPFSITLEQVCVGIMSNFIVFPPSFLIIFFFRKSRPRRLRPSRIQEALEKQRVEWQAKHGNATEDDGGGRITDLSDRRVVRRRKRKFTLPWWCVIFGWFFVVASIGVSIFFLWAYGIQFGNEKTSKWLTALVISFFSSVLLTQPIKIFLMAMFLSMICRKLDYDEDDADEDEEDPHLKDDEEWLHGPAPVRPQRRNYRPLDSQAIEAARMQREKELRMNTLVKEIFAYGIFLWIVIVLCMAQRDPNAYYMRLNLINDFIKPGDLWVDFNNVNTEARFWNWTNWALIPELIAGDWYNGRPPLGLRGFIDDRNNLKISYAVMRQIRIKPDSCTVAEEMKPITPECAAYGNIVFEDGGVYAKGWDSNFTRDTPIPQEYKYLTASQLKGYPFWGKMDYYGGGGYVVPLFEKQDQVRNIVKKLQDEGWVGRHTRAIFIEISVYNAQVNLFAAVTIVAEFLPGGGITPYYHIDPVRLLFYHNNSGSFFLAVQILFVIIIFVVTIREMRVICKERFGYFDQYWNICHLAILLFSYGGITIFVYRLFLTRDIMKIFKDTNGTGYVKLQEVVLFDAFLGYMLAFLMFLATLQFLKLLRFNSRMAILASTLKKCAEELRSFGICLMVVFVAFVFLFWLLLGRFMWEFSTFLLSFESCISMLLKKFKYTEMAAASPFFVPIVFFIFSISAAMILVNILLTIIIQSFEGVKQGVKEDKDYQMMQFVLTRIKLAVGVGKSKIQPLPPIVPKTKITPKQDTLEAFPNKVDQLLQFVNMIYFDGEIDFNSKDFLKRLKSKQYEEEEGKRKPSTLGKYGTERVRRKLGDV